MVDNDAVVQLTPAPHQRSDLAVRAAGGADGGVAAR